MSLEPVRNNGCSYTDDSFGCHLCHPKVGPKQQVVSLSSLVDVQSMIIGINDHRQFIQFVKDSWLFFLHSCLAVHGMSPVKKRKEKKTSFGYFIHQVSCKKKTGIVYCAHHHVSCKNIFLKKGEGGMGLGCFKHHVSCKKREGKKDRF